MAIVWQSRAVGKDVSVNWAVLAVVLIVAAVVVREAVRWRGGRWRGPGPRGDGGS